MDMDTLTRLSQLSEEARTASATSREIYDRMLNIIGTHINREDCDITDTEAEEDLENTDVGDDEMDAADHYYPAWTDRYANEFYDSFQERDEAAAWNVIETFDLFFKVHLDFDHNWTETVRSLPDHVKKSLELGLLQEDLPGDCLKNHFLNIEDMRRDLYRQYDHFMGSKKGVKACYLVLVRAVDKIFEMVKAWDRNGFAYLAINEGLFDHYVYDDEPDAIR